MRIHVHVHMYVYVCVELNIIKILHYMYNLTHSQNIINIHK